MNSGMLTTWLGFLVLLAGILVISRKNLALALISGAIILGLFTLTPVTLWQQIVRTLADPFVLMLALAMGIIPMLGGVMKDSGQVDSLVNNVRVGRRYLLPFSASLMGLLPMPGGALLSAPIVERGGEGVDDGLKAVINNWFRHLFILIYPLSSALIVAAEISRIDVYHAIVYVLPGFALALLLGYVFYLRRVNGRPDYDGRFSWPGLLTPLGIILCAPVLDFSLKRLFSLSTGATLIGVSTALLLSILLSRQRLDLGTIARRMRPWNFTGIIIGMFLYLHVFQTSDTGQLIGEIPLPPLVLSVLAGFILGIVTGRVQLPASIVLPVYLAAGEAITPIVFALIYISIYFGYITSPVHPCLIVTCEYFRVPIKDMILELALPTAIMFGSVLVIALVMAY